MNQATIEVSSKQAEYVRNANHRWNGKIGATQSGKTFIDTLYVIPSRLTEKNVLVVVGSLL